MTKSHLMRMVILDAKRLQYCEKQRHFTYNIYKRVFDKYGTNFLIYRVIGNIRREAYVRGAYMFWCDFCLVPILILIESLLSSRTILLISCPIFGRNILIICRRINKSLCVFCFTMRPLVITLIVFLGLRRYIHSAKSDVNKMCSSAIAFFFSSFIYICTFLYSLQSHRISSYSVFTVLTCNFFTFYSVECQQDEFNDVIL